MKETDILVCPPPSPDRTAAMRRVLDLWTGLPAMHRLVDIFGGTWKNDWDLDERLRFLEPFSDCWDFRRGVERLDASGISLTSEIRSQVEAAAADLGLTVAIPPRLKAYDYVLVLGGVALSCKLRTEYAAEIVQQMGVRTRAVALLGASRRIPDNEREVADTFAPGSINEFDMLNAAAEAAFDLKEGHEDLLTEHENENLCAVVRRYKSLVRPSVLSLCAPSSDTGRRANTEDTYSFLADVVKIQAQETLLICTSQIYLPFHLFGAMRMLALPYNVQVEVVGFPIDRGSGAGALRGTNNLLQEVRSGLQAAVRLKQALDSLG